MKKVHLKADLSDQQKANQIVKLNIGGVKYLTTEQTLCGGRENFFSGLLSGNLPALRDDDGFFFVDRNGELFRYVLEFLRTGRLKVPSELLDDVHAEAAFYSVDLRDFSLSDVALARWLDERQTMVVMQQWVKYPELEEIKEKVLGAFRHETQHGNGSFNFVMYPEMSSEGSVSRFIAKLIAEDEVSPEQRKVIETCKNQLLKCDFSSHPYYPLSLALWKVLQLPQCQTLLAQYLSATCSLTVQLRMSRIGVARVEKRQELDGASLYTVHDFYALTGMDKARNELSQTGTLRQQFDRCISAIQVVWMNKTSSGGVQSPKMTLRMNEDHYPSSPPL